MTFSYNILFFLVKQWLTNCKATFPRGPRDGVITCQPGDLEEKVSSKWPCHENKTNKQKKHLEVKTAHFKKCSSLWKYYSALAKRNHLLAFYWKMWFNTLKRSVTVYNSLYTVDYEMMGPVNNIFNHYLLKCLVCFNGINKLGNIFRKNYFMKIQFYLIL